jgi:anti-anti-sigma factor
LEFDIVEIAPDTNRVVLRGRLDAAAAERIEVPFTAAVATSPRHAVVDLRELEFLGSLGIRLIVSVARVLHGRGLKMMLHGPRPLVGELIAVVALDEFIPVMASEAEARAALAA